MKQSVKQMIAACLTLALVAAPSAVWAQEGTDSTPGSGDTTSTESPEPSRTPGTLNHDLINARQRLRDKLENLSQEHESQLGDKLGNLQERLSGDFKKACENHQETINRLMSVMDNRRQNALDRISKIADAIKAFYVKKGLSISNYDQLVAAVDAAKQAAQTTTDAQTAIPQLSCDGDHPRADVLDFRQKRLESIDALKAFRDAVKALGQAVKTALGDSKAQGPNTGTVSNNNDGPDANSPGNTGGATQ